MTKKHDLDTYSRLADAAEFYLNESFHYVDSALSYELASIMYESKLNKIALSKKDRQIANSLELKEDPVDFLQTQYGDILTEDTINKLADAWDDAQRLADRASHKFSKKHIIDSIELLGHVNSLAFFIETLTNRHLLFLHQTGKLDNFTYNNLSTAKILTRLIFACKEELEANKLQLNEISNLFSLRNKAVHYTPDNAIAFRTDIAALLRIWQQTVKTLKVFELKQKFVDESFSKDLLLHMQDFQKRWT